MVLAVFCYRIKLLNQEGNRNLSNLLLMVVNPCLIVTTYQTDYEPRLVKGLLLAFAAAFAAHMIGIFIARIAIRKKATKIMRLTVLALSIPTAVLWESL